jgi:hypothetical protein
VRTALAVWVLDPMPIAQSRAPLMRADRKRFVNVG